MSKHRRDIACVCVRLWTLYMYICIHTCIYVYSNRHTQAPEHTRTGLHTGCFAGRNSWPLMCFSYPLFFMCVLPPTIHSATVLTLLCHFYNIQSENFEIIIMFMCRQKQNPLKWFCGSHIYYFYYYLYTDHSKVAKATKWSLKIIRHLW